MLRSLKSQEQPRWSKVTDGCSGGVFCGIMQMHVETLDEVLEINLGKLPYNRVLTVIG
jgi:hypothetical protein